MARENLRPEITSDKQRFVDDPIYAEVSKAKPLALAVNLAALSMEGRSVDSEAQGFTSAHARGRQILPSIHEISHYERVRLRWMKPDGRGGLVPKYEK